MINKNKQQVNTMCFLGIEKVLLQTAIQGKLHLFGRIYKMEDNRKLKTLMLAVVDGTNNRGRPCMTL